MVGGLWGGVFLHLGLSFPSGRLQTRLDRVLVAAGYVIFPLAFVPARMLSGPSNIGCSGCPDEPPADRGQRRPRRCRARRSASLLYAGLFAVVLVRACRKWLAAGPFERLQLTPVYVCSLLTFLARHDQRGPAWRRRVVGGLRLHRAACRSRSWAGCCAATSSQLDAELRDRLEELRASRARLVQAGDAERRRLERDLHDGAQSRLVGALAAAAQRPERAHRTTGS